MKDAAHLHQEWPSRVRRSMRISILASPRTESPWLGWSAARPGWAVGCLSRAPGFRRNSVRASGRAQSSANSRRL